jgi:hypothetical protein
MSWRIGRMPSVHEKGAHVKPTCKEIMGSWLQVVDMHYA